ncbi:hypothetical protein DPMN_050877 [Dreissena polymorpha]|uniref:Uncharacterized protein n=1 Tax=Dreissena polymorpha TaxID=45954 RepID=A0A9D4CIE3_DREPO|nr:hypothetical protein DPMN_050877 [Dreissena polymorpha]
MHLFSNLWIPKDFAKVLDTLASVVKDMFIEVCSKDPRKNNPNAETTFTYSSTTNVESERRTAFTLIESVTAISKLPCIYVVSCSQI